MGIKRWLIHWAGGITQDEHLLDIELIKEQASMVVQEVVDKHEMQGAWEQVKQERQMRRYH